LDAALHDIEWWIGIGRLDYECAGMQGADHPFLPTHGVITRRARSTPNSASTFGVLFSHPDSVRHDLHAGHRANRWSLSLERSVRTGVSGVHSGTVPRSVATW